jgi:hypothetical protein
MKAIQSLSVSLLLAASVLPAPAQQQQPRSYFAVVMRNIAADKETEYLAFMNDAGKKLAQSRMDAGEIRGWMHLRLATMLTPTAGYNYVTVSILDKEPELVRAPGAWDAHARKAGFASYGAYSAKAMTFGPVTRSELTRTRVRIGDAAVGDYIRVAQYSIANDHLNERIAWLTENAAPISRMRIEAGDAQKAYGISTLVLPAGAEAGYNYSTSVVLKDSASVLQGPSRLSEGEFTKAHPGKSYATYLTESVRWQGLSKLERVRVYRVIDKIGALPQVSGGVRPTN